MSLKSGMQALNLGLSIFSKIQLIQHRNIKIAQHLSDENTSRKRGLASRKHREPQVADAEIISSTPNEI